MKITSWLVSLIILFVGFTTCKDTYGRQVSSNTFNSFNYQNENQHAGVTDFCSPFCACSCCCSPTVITPEAIDQSISTTLKKDYTYLYSGCVASAFIAVWQPPKLFS